MVTYRILVTGWRFWPRNGAWWVCDRLQEHAVHAGALPRLGDLPVTVVDGECPYGGVDLYAHEWAMFFYGPRGSERHPAPWKELGKAAGFQRNSHMVNLGADVCLGFPGPPVPGKKGGTRDCMEKAAATGIEVHEYSWEDFLRATQRG